MDFQEINRQRFVQMFPSVLKQVRSEEELDETMEEYVKKGFFLTVVLADDEQVDLTAEKPD